MNTIEKLAVLRDVCIESEILDDVNNEQYMTAMAKVERVLSDEELKQVTGGRSNYDDIKYDPCPRIANE